MPYDVFTPPRPPQIGTGQDVQYRTLTASFGDGYEQSAEDGLNTALEQWTLIWNGLKPSEFQEIRTFLNGKKGVTPFYWTPPDEAQQRLVKCPGFNRGDASETTDRLTASFREVVDLS